MLLRLLIVARPRTGRSRSSSRAVDPSCDRTAVVRTPGGRGLRGRLVLVLATALLGVATPSTGQEPPDATANSGLGPDRKAIEQRKAEVAKQIDELRATTGFDPSRLDLLKRLDRRLFELLDEIERSDDLDEQRDVAQQKLAQPPAEQLGHDPPYTLAEYDAALGELEATDQVMDDLEKVVASAETELEVARDSLEQVERERRAAREGQAVEKASGLFDLRIELANTELWLRRRQIENARNAVAVQKLETSALGDVVDWVASRVAARPDELAERVAELDARAAALSRERKQAELRLQTARQGWERAASRASAEQPDAGVQAELAARRAQFEGFEKQVALLGERLDRLERAQQLLQRRFSIYSADRPGRYELSQWNDESSEAIAALEREIRLDQAERETLNQEMRTLEGSLGSGAEHRWEQRQLEALRDSVAAHEANLESLDEALRRERQLTGALDRELSTLDLGERFAELRSLLAAAWSFEITSSEDRAITVGKIATGLLVFALGLLLARAFAYWFGSRLLSRVRLDEGAAHAYQSLGYYALLAIAFITALRVVDIPLTAFAVVGGALAIGVGFGSQNIVNNFISGLILLAERPIKRGDLVELEGTYGNIDRIGLRSTSVRTGDNIHVIVPNSAFLETRVVNWTHNDRRVRINVAVGVAYGSPTREVEQLFLQAIQEHPKVLKNPEPIVLFTDFGDNSLNFQAWFWVLMQSQMARLVVESEIRFRVDELFREANVVIAFPQRDVHLDALKPLPVRLTNGGTDDGAGV